MAGMMNKCWSWPSSHDHARQPKHEVLLKPFKVTVDNIAHGSEMFCTFRNCIFQYSCMLRKIVVVLAYRWCAIMQAQRTVPDLHNHN